MIREVILQATGQVSAGGSRDPGSSPYPWNNTPTKTLAECWSDDDVWSYWYNWPNKNAGGAASALASFEAAPTLVLFRSVKIEAWWTYSQSGPNNWYFPPTNAFGPRARLLVRNRAKDGNNAGPWEAMAAEIPDWAAYNENINTHNGDYEGPYLQTWEMTSHPEGGIWSPEDMSAANFAAGIEVAASAPAFTNEQGSFFKIRVHKLRVVLSVEDLGGYVRNVRHASALELRLHRRARNAFPTRSLARYAKGDLGSVVWHSRPEDAPAVSSEGWGRRRLERRSGQVLQRTYFPEQISVESQVFDREDFRCLFWAAYRIDCAWSPELQGLAYLDKGGDFIHSRAQDGWSARPGDGALMRVIEDYPNVCSRGLAAQGGSDVAVCLRNYDLMQAGWSTVGSAGTFSAAADLTVNLVEEQGYLSSCRLTYGPAGGGAGGRERSLGTLPFDAGDYVHVRVVLKNTSVPDPTTQNGEWYLKRSGGGLPAAEYWDETNRVWTVVATYNAVPSDEPSGEAIADAIPCDAPGAASDPTYVIGVGRFSSNLVSVTLHGAVVDVQHGGPGAGDSYGARTPLVTIAATITREPDVHRLENSLAAELWSYERGVAVVEIQPFWRAEVLPDGETKPLLHAYHAADTWDALQFIADGSEDDLIRFERAVSGQATFQLDCPIAALDLNRSHVLRAWVRWLGTDGWTEYGPWSIEVGYAVFLETDGTLVQSGSVLGRLAYEGAMVSRDWLGLGNDHLGRFADAFIRMVEIRRNPVSGLEAIWRV